MQGAFKGSNICTSRYSNTQNEFNCKPSGTYTRHFDAANLIYSKLCKDCRFIKFVYFSFSNPLPNWLLLTTIPAVEKIGLQGSFTFIPWSIFVSRFQFRNKVAQCFFFGHDETLESLSYDRHFFSRSCNA